jgi:hypothetical protein
VLSGTDKLLIFGLAKKMNSSDLPLYFPTNETSERLVVNKPVKLGFSLHQQVLEEFFDKKRNGLL